MRPLLLLALLLLAGAAAADDAAPYSALDSLERAHVGTSSPDLAPPVRVEEPAETEPTSAPAPVEQIECHRDPAKRLPKVIICTPEKSKN